MRALPCSSLSSFPLATVSPWRHEFGSVQVRGRPDRPRVFSLFPVVAIGDTIGLPPPLFLVHIQSRPVWPRSPSSRWVSSGSTVSLSRSLVSSWRPYSCVCARSRPGWTDDCHLFGVFRELLTDDVRGTSCGCCFLGRGPWTSWVPRFSGSW